MKDDEKQVKQAQTEAGELDLDALEQAAGGSLGNVQYTKTVDISADTKAKI
jgi:hypothetical protein